MSINQLIEKLNTEAPSWVNLRINNLIVDQEITTNGINFFSDDPQNLLNYYYSPVTPLVSSLSGNNGGIITPFDIEVYRIGDLVTLSLPVFTSVPGSTNNVYSTLITEPSLRPAKRHVFSVVLSNGASYFQGVVTVEPDGVIEIIKETATNFLDGDGFGSNVSLTYLIK